MKPAKGFMQLFLVHSSWGSFLPQICKLSLYSCAYQLSSDNHTLPPSFCHLSLLGFPWACFSSSHWPLLFSDSSRRSPYEVEVNTNIEIQRKVLLILAKVNSPWVYPLVSFISKENFRFQIADCTMCKCERDCWQRGLERIIFWWTEHLELNCLKSFYFCLHLKFTHNKFWN